MSSLTELPFPTAEQRLEWATQILEAQLQERAYAESVYDLYKLYHEDLSTWASLKARVLEGFPTPQQVLVLDILFKVSRASDIQGLADSFRAELPTYLAASVKW